MEEYLKAELDKTGGWHYFPEWEKDKKRLRTPYIKHSYINGGDSEEWVRMRGSREAFFYKHASRWSRKYEAAYMFAQWLGRKFANHYIRTGKKVVKIKTNRLHSAQPLTNGDSCDMACFNRCFSQGFYWEMEKLLGFEEAHKIFHQSQKRRPEADLIQRAGRKHNGSSIYLFCQIGLTGEQVSAIYRLIHQDLNVEEIERSYFK